MKVKLANKLIAVISVGVLIYLGYKVFENKIALKTLFKNESQLGLPNIKDSTDNPITIEKVALGRKLFMDRRLSHNNTISCGMCHVPEQGFTSNELATAVGIEGRTGRRNSPTILNVGYLQYLFHDGRENTLENQVLGPMLAFNEMGNPSVGHVVEKIRKLKDYAGMFEDVFGEPVNLNHLTQAIAAYERTLISGNSRFDQWYYGNNHKVLNQTEINGFNVFMTKGKCSTCHNITEKYALFTDQSFHNTGIGWSRNNKVVNKIYENKTFPVTLAPGVVVNVAQDHFDEASEVPQNDVGRFEITENPNDSWSYKTPSIRNIGITAPYMHDGSLRTLEEVVEFYNKGGDENPYKDQLIKPLGLAESEKKSLVAFLKSLTGSNVINLEHEARSAYNFN